DGERLRRRADQGRVLTADGGIAAVLQALLGRAVHGHERPGHAVLPRDQFARVAARSTVEHYSRSASTPMRFASSRMRLRRRFASSSSSESPLAFTRFEPPRYSM